MKSLVYLGLCITLSLVLVFGPVSVVGLILPVYAQSEYVAFPETVSISSSDLVPHNFILKAILKQNGGVEKVSGFKLDPVNVISVLEGGAISAKSTDEVIVFGQAKAKSSTDSLFELQKTTATQGQQQPQQNGGFSLAGLAPGVYTLDIIAAKNNAKAAYEGILVIGQNPESQEVKQVVEREIIEVERDTPTTIIPVFQPPSNPQPPIIIQPPAAVAAIPLGGQPPVNLPSPPPQALAAQQQPPSPPSPATTAAAPQSDTPPDGTPCTGVDNVDIGVYKNGKCTPETLSPEPPQAPATAAALPRGTIPSCILTADCPRTPPPQALAAQPPPPSPPPSTDSSSTESGNGNGPDPCLIDPSSPECQVVDTFDTPSETQSCPTGTQGTPPECSPVQPGNEPVELASTDPNDPLAGEAGQTGEGGEAGQTGEGGEAGQTGEGGEAGQTGEGGEAGTEDTEETARESQDTDEEDSESESESDGGSDGDGGDGGDGGEEE